VDSTLESSGLIQDFDDGEGVSRLMEVLFWFISSRQASGLSRACFWDHLLEYQFWAIIIEYLIQFYREDFLAFSLLQAFFSSCFSISTYTDSYH
jgi:hypothetical protein